MPNSMRLISYFRRVSYWSKGLERITPCWRAEEDAGVKYSEEELKKLHEASRLFDQAQRLYTEVWSARIGQAVTEETRAGA